MIYRRQKEKRINPSSLSPIGETNYTASLSSVPTSNDGPGGIQFHAAAMANLSGLLQVAAARSAANQETSLG